MKNPVQMQLVCWLIAAGPLGAIRSATAQVTYVVSDQGKANAVTSDLPAWWYFCSTGPALCKDEIVMNAQGQIAIKKARPTAAAVNYVLFWEPGMTTPVAIGGGDTQGKLAAMSSNGWLTGSLDGGITTLFRSSRAQGYTVLCCGDSYYPLAINASGVVVGWTDAGHRALIWNDRDPVFLDDLNIVGKQQWPFQEAQGIADNGVISGVGLLTTSTGAQESHFFLLTPTTSAGEVDRTDWTVMATEASLSDPPRNAIDGNLNTRWSTGQAQHDSQGFFVSWTSDRTIARIRFEVGPSTGDYPRTCGIWLKDTGGNVTAVNCQAGTEEYRGPGPLSRCVGLPLSPYSTRGETW